MQIAIPVADDLHSFQVPDANLLIHCGLPTAEALSADALRAAIRQALEQPIGVAPLADMVHGARRVALIVDDWARPVVTRHAVAPIVLDLLNEYGVADHLITVVMARGLGLSPSADTVLTAFGPALMQRAVHKDVSSYQPSRLDFFGYSSLGTPIWIDRTVARADLVLGIGITFPSPWGGWSGGAKIVVPGVAGAETIRQNHSLMTKVPMGSTDSPGMADREEIAHIAGLDMLINLILNLDGQVVDLAAGEPRATHRQVIRSYRRHYEVCLPESPDIVVTTLQRFAGYPMVNLYPFVDGCLPATELVCAPGSTIIVVGRCPQGVGAAINEYLATTYTPADLAALKAQASAAALGFVAVTLGARYAEYRHNYQLVAVIDDLSDADCQRIGITKAPSLQQALDRALERHGCGAKVAVLPALGNIVLPSLATSVTRTPAAGTPMGGPT
jgi:nickel-dependent lactate racemase